MSNLSSVWTESGTVVDGVVLSLTAVDQEAADAAEAHDFVRKLRTASEADPHDRDAGTRAGCLYALAVPVLLLAALVLAGTFEAMGLPALVGFALPPAAAAIVLLTRFWRAHSVRLQRAQQQRVFEFEVRPSELVLREGGRVRYQVATAMVARFVGGARLSIERAEGGLDVLPLRVASGGHDALAVRLNEIIREARALGGGYRGNDRIRVAAAFSSKVSDEDPITDEDEDEVAIAERRRR